MKTNRTLCYLISESCEKALEKRQGFAFACTFWIRRGWNWP